MKIIKLKDKFKVESHTKGKFYIVDLNQPSCTCPHFMFRLKSTGGECKHIIAVKEKYSKRKIPKKIKKEHDKILQFIRKKGSIDSMELIKKFGDKLVESLIKSGDLIEKQGKIKVLE